METRVCSCVSRARSHQVFEKLRPRPRVCSRCWGLSQAQELPGNSGRRKHPRSSPTITRKEYNRFFASTLQVGRSKPRSYHPASQNTQRPNNHENYEQIHRLHNWTHPTSQKEVLVLSKQKLNSADSACPTWIPQVSRARSGARKPRTT